MCASAVRSARTWSDACVRGIAAAQTVNGGRFTTKDKSASFIAFFVVRASCKNAIVKPLGIAQTLKVARHL
jgi:hypothetical protein